LNKQSSPFELSILNIAISAGGSTLYELASCGVSTIAIKVAENQILLVNELEKRGIVIGLDSDNKNFGKELTKDIMFLITDRDRRREMAAKAVKMADSNGHLACKRIIGEDKNEVYR